MTSWYRTRGRSTLRARRASIRPGARVAGWAHLLGAPRAEPRSSQRIARFGGVMAILALVLYVLWRILFTLPDDTWDLTAAWVLIAFEALPVFGLVIRVATLWNIDCRAPGPVIGTPPTVAVLIPTYNEPVEVIAPTIAAACVLQPAHATWVLDDGDRPWVREMCEEYGARYVRREEHTHAKAGNMNHALALMAEEAAAGGPSYDALGVLDCDHVPLPTFLSSTLAWFNDPRVALVQAPQTYYNSGAFDDDGVTGEQGVFFHVLLPARNHDGAGPFWCGSTSLIRTAALMEVGGISTDTIVEDMHTTLNLIRNDWKTVYHHQALAVGLAPDTAEQYLLQRRRWAMGSMQVLTKERLWGAKRWLSWRNYYEYLSGTLWWLEGVATVLVFVIPAAVLVSGAQTSTASPWVFAVVFIAMFSLRLWGTKRLFRHHMHWPTAFALRIFRVPVGISCLWWLVTRRTLQFQVTPKAGADERVRGQVPRVLWGLIAIVAAVILYAVAGLLDWVPWRATPSATIASGAWLVFAGIVMIMGMRRINDAEFASSRRNAHRIAVQATVNIDGVDGELVDISVGGAAVRFAKGVLDGPGRVEIVLPGTDPIQLMVVRTRADTETTDIASLRVEPGDYAAFRAMSLWLFHTPTGVVQGIPPRAPAAAATTSVRRARPPSLIGHGV